MKLDKQIWDEMNNVLRAFVPFYRERTSRHLLNLDINHNWAGLGFVRAQEPEPFTLEQAFFMAPYSSPERRKEQLETLVEDGCLEGDSDQGYRLTDRGRDVVEGFFREAQAGLLTVEPLAPVEMKEMVDLIDRLVNASLQAPKPLNKPSLVASRWTDPGEDSSYSARADQTITDLYRFRDDVHISVWKPLGLGGHGWEALTLIWREEASTAAEIADQLSFRGYSEDDYTQVCKVLQAKGYTEQEGGKYRVTKEGKSLRETAESDTDIRFFAGWSILTSDEKRRLIDLLTRAREALTKQAMEQFWPLASGVARAINPVTRSAVNPVFGEYFENPQTFFPLLMAMGKSPAPFKVDDYHRRFPYANPDRLAGNLASGVEAGLLAGNGQGFTVTERGERSMHAVDEAFYNCLDEMDVLPEEQLWEIEQFLGQLVDASLNAEEPPEKWAIHNMYQAHPQKEYGPLARIDQHLDDLIAFRDDVHIAAWRPYVESGRTWETFSLIWDKRAESIEGLAENLQNRGYSEEDYNRSLKELSDKGWLEENQGKFNLTADGRAIRDRVEAETNRYFYAPWSCLEEQELVRLRDLLIRLKLRLERRATEEAQVPESA